MKKNILKKKGMKTMEMPKIYRDGNSNAVSVGDLRLYFSYDTLIGYEDSVDGRVATRNYWGPTTGKHLNSLDVRQDERCQKEEFEAKVSEMLKRHGLES